MKNVFVVIPNWDGRDFIGDAIDSLRGQVESSNIIVVDNGSTDGSVEFIEDSYPDVTLIKNTKNLGFSGGVNMGINRALELGADYVALLNNDAMADKKWLAELVGVLVGHKGIGIVTSKIKRRDSNLLDSTGDFYTNWLLPYPRGRDEIDSGQYDSSLEFVTSGSGGASIYRAKMLRQIGLFDEDFFAYYEDVDISLRAQHYGWKVAYNSKAVVSHSVGATSNRIRGFRTFQSIKNLPLLFIKNVPFSLLIKYGYKFGLAYLYFLLKSAYKGQVIYAVKGLLVCLVLLPKKIKFRLGLLKISRLSPNLFNDLLVHDAPPNVKKIKPSWLFAKVIK